MQASLIDDASSAATTTPHAAPRFDLYRDIHKALRAAMSDALVAVGRTDAADAAETVAATTSVRGLLTMCLMHVDKENRYVHPAIEARAPGATLRIGHEHDQHLQAIADLVEDVQVVEAASDAGRAAALARLYQHLSLFVAENFEHMMVEETAHNAQLWANYSDDELHAIEGRILASIAPTEMMAVLRWMVPSITADARAELFAGMRQGMPPPVFANVLQFAKSTLAARDVEKLEQSLAG